MYALSFAFGVWLLQQQAVLPEAHGIWLLALLTSAYLLPVGAIWQRVLRRSLLLVWAGLFGFFYAALFAQQHLADSLPEAWQGRDIEVIGVVAELPKQHAHGLSFSFDVEQTRTPEAQVPPHLLLSTYNSEKSAPLALHAGERWQLTLRLKQPHGSLNPHGFDFAFWLLEHNLRATGYVQHKAVNTRLDALVERPDYLLESLRETLRSRLQTQLADAPYAGVLIALAIGDQGSIPAAQWQVFTRTGVNHLMSISGLHITMLAGLAYAIAYRLWRRSVRLTLRLPARKAAALMGLLVALAYSLLSGFSVPAQRTLYMLTTVAFGLMLSRQFAPRHLLSAALWVVLLLDPWAIMSPGFWLSFGAVGLIFYVSSHRLGKAHWLAEYLRVQWAMSIGLIPPLLALFQQISLVSPLANAFAIPLVSFVVVPLTMLGAVLPLDFLLTWAHAAMSACMVALEWLNALPDAVWTQHAPPVWSIVVGLLGVLWILLPSGFPARWLGGLLLLPMFLIAPPSPPPGTLRLLIFDVGQGLAVAAQTAQHALLYDTGPDFSDEADSGNRILIPALRALGMAQLDTLILTHNDSDHTGGARSVLQAMPVDRLISSLPEDSPILLARQATHENCHDGQSWHWDGVQFDMLHPAIASYADSTLRDNDRGCVLRIRTGKHSVLLAADIEKGSEWRLLKQHAEQLPATLLLVPHHGSKTSSVASFVAAVHPRYAVFTVGFRNRFGHPKEEVLERYRAAGSELLRSDKDGAILVEMSEEHFNVQSYRNVHARYWYAD